MSLRYGFASKYSPVPGLSLGLYSLISLDAACVYLQVHCHCDLEVGHRGLDYYTGYVRFLKPVSILELTSRMPACIWYPVDFWASSDQAYVDRLLPSSDTGLCAFSLF